MFYVFDVLLLIDQGSVPSLLLSAHQPTVPLLPKLSPATPGPSHASHVPSTFSGSVSVSSLMAVELRKVSTLETSRTSYLKQKMQARIPLMVAVLWTIPYHNYYFCQKVALFMPLKSFLGSRVVVFEGTLRKKLLQWLSLSNCLSFCILFDTLRPKSQPKFPYHGFVGVLHAAGTRTTMI